MFKFVIYALDKYGCYDYNFGKVEIYADDIYTAIEKAEIFLKNIMLIMLVFHCKRIRRWKHRLQPKRRTLIC